MENIAGMFMSETTISSRPSRRVADRKRSQRLRTLRPARDGVSGAFEGARSSLRGEKSMRRGGCRPLIGVISGIGAARCVRQIPGVFFWKSLLEGAEALVPFLHARSN